MNLTYREEGSRINRNGRDDGICITFEYGNYEYYIMSELVKRYRLFIDYTGEDGTRKTVFFKDGTYIKGDLEINILKKLRLHNGRLSLESLSNLTECINDFETNGKLNSDKKN